MWEPENVVPAPKARKRPRQLQRSQKATLTVLVKRPPAYRLKPLPHLLSQQRDGLAEGKPP